MQGRPWSDAYARTPPKAKCGCDGVAANTEAVDSIRVRELLRENEELRAELGELNALLDELAAEFEGTS